MPGLKKNKSKTMAVKNITIFQHIYKNGGTSVRKGFNAAVLTISYPDNKEKLFYSIITDGNEDTHQFNPRTLINKDAPTFFTGNCNIWKIKNKLQNFNVQYVITLREPIDRLFSAYNFYLIQCKRLLNISEFIPFKVWYYNRFTLAPTTYEDQIPEILDRFRDKLYTKNEYHTQFNSPVFFKVRQQIILKRNKKILNDKMRQVDEAIELLQKYCNLVTFMEEDYIETLKHYLNLPFNDANKQENTGKEHYENLFNKNYYFSEKDIPVEDFELVKQELEPEIIFYKKCKEIFI